MPRRTRRQFLAQSATTAAGALLWAGPATAVAAKSGPSLRFPSQPRERLSIASYPFRGVVAGPGEEITSSKMDLKDFAAHVSAKLDVKKIEPWSRHFRSVDPKYLEQFRAAVEKAHGAIVNIAVDGDHSPYAADRAERDRAVQFSMQWIDVAAAIGSPSVRTNLPSGDDSKPSLELVAESLARVADHGAKKNVVVNLENDNPVSEEPFFLVKVIEKVGSPWLHALPDFGNSLVHFDEDHAYRGIDAMFGHAYNICHVKGQEPNDEGKLFHVDMARTFGMLKRRGYKGYCSMEWDSPGDPYAGTAQLIETTLKNL